MGIDARRPILTFRSSPSGSSSESQRIVQGSTSPTLTRWMPPPISQGQRGPGGCRRARGHRLRGEARGGGALGVQVWQTRVIQSSAGTLLRCQKFKQWRERFPCQRSWVPAWRSTIFTTTAMQTPQSSDRQSSTVACGQEHRRIAGPCAGACLPRQAV